MSKLGAAPPNTHAGGNPMNPLAPVQYADDRVDMDAYAKDVPLWKRMYQNSLTQMMLLSVQAFCGPAMADAIAG